MCSVVCLQAQRTIALRFQLFSCKPNGAEEKFKDTGLLKIGFKCDEEVPLMTLDDSWTFPVYVSARWMMANPNDPAADGASSSPSSGGAAMAPAAPQEEAAG